MREEMTTMTAKAIPMKTYITNNDLTGAYKRFQNAKGRWKDQWWNTVETIFYGSAEWATKFILDPVARILQRIKQGFDLSGKIEGLTENVQGTGAYIVQHFDKDGNPLWIKVGEAQSARQRLYGHLKSGEYAKHKIDRAKVLAWYPCKSVNHALSVENLLRDHFQNKGYKLMGHDRFPGLEKLTKHDLKTLQTKIDMMETLF